MNAYLFFVLHFTFLFDQILTQEWQPNLPYEYYLSSEKKSFDEARSICKKESDNADLVMIKTLEIQTFIEGFIPEGRSYVQYSLQVDYLSRNATVFQFFTTTTIKL